MKPRTPGDLLAALAVWLVAGAALAADEPVPALQDLMGAKGASVEPAMTRRGYAFEGRGTGARSDVEYWREGKTSACVGVRYRDNRVTAVLRATGADCARRRQTSRRRLRRPRPASRRCAA